MMADWASLIGSPVLGATEEATEPCCAAQAIMRKPVQAGPGHSYE